MSVGGTVVTAPRDRPAACASWGLSPRSAVQAGVGVYLGPGVTLRWTAADGWAVGWAGARSWWWAPAYLPAAMDRTAARAIARDWLAAMFEHINQEGGAS